MPRCTFKNFAGKICNIKSDKLDYVLLHDPHGRLDIVRYGCNGHMTLIIEDLMVEQMQHEKHMKAVIKQIELKQNELFKGVSVAEERQKIRDAKADGLQEPKMKKTTELKKEIKDSWQTVKNIKAILQKKRNKYCVYCTYPLRDPEEPKDQIGDKFSNADFKGSQGYRRYDALFHSECFISWYTNKFQLSEKEMASLSPKRVGQNTLFQ